MSSKYNKQLVVNISMEEPFESDDAKALLNKALKNGLISDFAYTGINFIDRKLDENYIRGNFPPGQDGFYMDNERNRVILGSKNIVDEKIEIKEFDNLEKALEYKLDNIKKLIDNLDHNSRIYFFGHGKKGSDLMYNIGRKPENHYSYKQLTSLLKNNTKLQQSSSKPITISLIMCEGARDNLGNDSFAYKLSRELAKAGIYAKVLARFNTMTVTHDKKNENLHKEVLEIHHSANSKVCFETDPKTLKTLQRDVIYRDNASSLICALNDADILYSRIKRNEKCLASDPKNSELQFKIAEDIQRLAVMSFDIACEAKMDKNFPQKFKNLNNLRWGIESDIKPRELYSYVTERLTTDIIIELNKGNSIIKNLNKDFIRCANVAISGRYEDLLELDKSLLTRIEKLRVDYDVESSLKLRQIPKKEKSQIDTRFLAQYICFPKYRENISMFKDSIRASREIVEEYTALLARVCLKRGIVNDEIKKYKEMFRDISSKMQIEVKRNPMSKSLQTEAKKDLHLG